MRTVVVCEGCGKGYPTMREAEECEAVHGKPTRESMRAALKLIQAEAANTIMAGGGLSPAYVLELANRGLHEC